MQRLHEHLQQANSGVITAVIGMGGIGKTELALQYVRTYREQAYPGGVCWLEARDQDITTQILTFAAIYLNYQPNEELPLDAKMAACWNHWPDFSATDGTAPAPALVVIDDVTDYDAIAPYLPIAPRFAHLLTTRRQHLATTIQSLQIDVLDEPTALELLQQLAGEQRIEIELAQAKRLCEWLGYLPLGLELVGRYLARKQDLSLAELQQRLEEQDLAARALVKAEPGMTNAKGVASAFELSWLDLSPNAQELARLLSCFALAPIPWHRVQAFLPETDTEVLEELRDEELQRFNLLKRVGVNRYQLHHLIQRFIRIKLMAKPSVIAAYCRAMVSAAQEIDSTPTQAQCQAWREMPPHVAECIHQWLDWVQDDCLTSPFTGLQRYYKGQGLYAQAEPWCEQAVVATRQRLSDDDPGVATSLNNLASLYQAQGHYSEAEPLFTEALEISKRTLGKDHPEVTTILNNLASSYYAQGHYSEAEPLFTEALEIGKRTLGKDHPEVTTRLGNLGSLYQTQGRYSDAEPLLTEALEIGKRTLGKDHPEVTTRLGNLGSLYQAQGRYSDAEPLLTEALDISKRTLGKDHPEVTTRLGNLGSLYQAQGRYSDAEPLLTEALEIGKRTLGKDHPKVADMLSDLASLHQAQGRYSDAEPLLTEALEISKRTLGKDHPKVATRLANLAGLHQAQERHSDAEPLFTEALEISKRTLDDDHPKVATILNNLASLHQAQERYSDAESLLKQAIDISKRTLGKDHPNVAHMMFNLGALQYQQKEFASASSSLLKAKQIYQLRLGDDHPTTRNLQTWLDASQAELDTSGESSN